MLARFPGLSAQLHCLRLATSNRARNMVSQVENPGHNRLSEQASFWDSAAQACARKPMEEPAAYERKPQHMLQNLRPTESALEIGCGTGNRARSPVAKGMPAANITVVDNSPECRIAALTCQFASSRQRLKLCPLPTSVSTSAHASGRSKRRETLSIR